MFITSKDKIDEVYDSLQEHFKIEDYGVLKNYLGIDLDLLLDVSIHIRQPYLTQIIPNMIPGMYNSSNNPTPAVKHHPEKMRDLMQKNMALITDH